MVKNSNATYSEPNTGDLCRFINQRVRPLRKMWRKQTAKHDRLIGQTRDVESTMKIRFDLSIWNQRLPD